MRGSREDKEKARFLLVLPLSFRLLITNVCGQFFELGSET